MPVGFQSLIPDIGVVQIDSESRCYGLISKTTTSATNYSVSLSGVESPLVFVSPGVYATSERSFVNIYGGDAVYYVFGLIPTSSGPGVGLQLRNSAGLVTFDSNYPPLVVHFAGGSYTPIPNGVPGRQYAIHYGGIEESAYNTGIEVNGEFLYEFTSRIFYLGSNGVMGTSPTVVSENLAPDGAFNEYTSPESFIIIADVTGF